MTATSSSFERLAQVSDRYAALPVTQAFTWEACIEDVSPGEWYMVAFRSVRRSGSDEARLTAYDDWAHTEAAGAPGFVRYFKGATLEDGRCMSFCLWNSRAEARAAAGRPAHVEAAGLTFESYASYTLEFNRGSPAGRRASVHFPATGSGHRGDRVARGARGRAVCGNGLPIPARAFLSRPSAIARWARSLAPGLAATVAAGMVARVRLRWDPAWRSPSAWPAWS